jgi:hypothetical protein
MLHRRRLALAILILAALATAACASQDTNAPTRPPATSGPDASGSLPSSAPSAAPTGGQPGESASPGGDVTPAPGEATPPDNETPVPSGDTPAPTGEPSGSPTPGAGASACSGTVDNRTFFGHIAGQVAWNVYCAVLPPRWFVETGQFSLRDGGRMEISYKGPGGARLTLQEGSYCTEGLSACSPKDQSLGQAAFGDRSGGLVSLGPNSGFAVYVDPGQAPSWTATGTGMDQATFIALVAALYRVQP